MKTYLCINRQTGKMTGTWGPSNDRPPRASEKFVFLDADEFPDATSYDTFSGLEPADENEEDGVFTAARQVGQPPVRTKILTRYEFMSLLTQQEYLTLIASAESDNTIKYALAMFELAGYVECVPPAPLVSQMLAYVVQANIMTAQRRTQFVNEMNDKAHY